MLGFYTRILSNYPIATQAGTTGMLFGTGDLIAQFLIEHQNKVVVSHDRLKSTDTSIGMQSWDKARTARMMLFGTCFAGPVLHQWYKFLDKTIRLSTPVQSLLGRVAVDQIFFAPCFIASFFVGQGLLADEGQQVILNKLKKGYPEALKSNYMVWPAVQCLNFWLVPLQHRLMVVNTFALGWNTYLSHVNQTTRSSIHNE